MTELATSGHGVIHFRPLILVGLLAAFLLLPSMASIGMFMDGTLYAAISRNLAEGLGSAWSLHFSEGLFPVFREHPPLAFWQQSLFFHVLGDSYLTERAYDLVIVLTTGVLMVLLWRCMVAARGLDSLACYWWLPVLLWVLLPTWSWTYRNNMLESTLTVFCLAAVLLLLGSLLAASGRRAVAGAAGAAVMTLLAFMTKGPVALFVLVAPLLLGPLVAAAHARRTLIVMSVLWAGFAASIALLLAWPDARDMLYSYWQKQVMGRVGIASNDAGLLLELAQKLAVMLLVLLGFRVWTGRDQSGGWLGPVIGPILAMLMLGCAASLPLLLGDLGSTHYLVPALPLFAIGFGLAGAAMLDASSGNRIRRALSARPGRTFIALSALALMAVLAFSLSRIGEVRKNEAHHAFLEQVAAVTGESTAIALDPALYRDWYLHAIAMRHYRIGFVATASRTDWLLLPVAAEPESGYRSTGIENDVWRLWQRDTE